jgi:hypothetical protein
MFIFNLNCEKMEDKKIYPLELKYDLSTRKIELIDVNKIAVDEEKE